MFNAYNNGVAARRQGRSRLANPHQPTDADYSRWANGWWTRDNLERREREQQEART